MSFFRIRRDDDDEELGFIETYLTDDEEWGTEEEASHFDTLDEAVEAYEENLDDSGRFNYSYEIEEFD